MCKYMINNKRDMWEKRAWKGYSLSDSVFICTSASQKSIDLVLKPNKANRNTAFKE